MSRLWPAVPALLAAAAIAAAVYWYHTWQHWLAFATGSYNVSGVAHNYNFFSGAGSDISELGIFVTLTALLYHAYRKGNCHADGCWRIGTHPNGDYKVCRRHHRESTGVKKVDIAHLRWHHEERARPAVVVSNLKHGGD